EVIGAVCTGSAAACPANCTTSAQCSPGYECGGAGKCVPWGIADYAYCGLAAQIPDETGNPTFFKTPATRSPPPAHEIANRCVGNQWGCPVHSVPGSTPYFPPQATPGRCPYHDHDASGKTPRLVAWPIVPDCSNSNPTLRNGHWIAGYRAALLSSPTA